MSIKPILFSTPMVQAILDGRKHMTRRIVKPKYSNTHFEFHTNKYGTEFVEIQNEVEGETWGKNPDGSTWHKLIGFIVPKPRYSVGDILWVRETWTPFCINKNTCRNNLLSHSDYCYKASPEQCVDDLPCHWRPSIFMPKSAARIWLKVTGVRVERVQDITEEDAVMEGCAGMECDCLHTNLEYFGCENCLNTGWRISPKTEFMDLWDHLNAKRGYPWSRNPWVFVYTFERCDKPQEV